MRDLNEIRKNIDKIDSEILELLQQRFELVAEVGELKNKDKSSIYRPEREREILENLYKKIADKKLISKSAIKAIYQEIFAISRNLESAQKVAFLGPIGSYTHEAAGLKFGALARYEAISNISAIFKEVQQGRAKYGVVPIENNTNGVVGETIDCLNSGNLKIIAEVVLPIRHCLASACEQFSQIKKIYSKDIAFGQCAAFLRAHRLDNAEFISVDSTSKAAQIALKEPESAAICAEVAAKIYDLGVLAQNIQDSQNNKTRFVVISDFDVAPSGADKTSVFAVLDGYKKPGVLFELLRDFKELNINITKLDSRPTRLAQKGNGDFSFGFFIDFDGHFEDENVKQLFARHKDELKWLGSYVRETEFE